MRAVSDTSPISYLLLIGESGRRGLVVTGLVGILDQAARRSIIDMAGVVERLRRASFHVAPWLLKELLDRHAR